MSKEGKRSAPVGGGRADEIGEVEINEARFALYNSLIEPYRDAWDSDSDENLARGFLCYIVAYGDDISLLEKSENEIRDWIECQVRDRIAASSPAEARAHFATRVPAA